jgi:hypothetical protein
MEAPGYLSLFVFHFLVFRPLLILFVTKELRGRRLTISEIIYYHYAVLQPCSRPNG